MGDVQPLKPSDSYCGSLEAFFVKRAQNPEQDCAETNLGLRQGQFIWRKLWRRASAKRSDAAGQESPSWNQGNKKWALENKTEK